MPKLCLNMIVRNEEDKIERCLASVAPYIDCWSITDTGSTDDTPAAIIAFFGAKGIPGHIHSVAFEDFEQARNQALINARTDPLVWDYLLLCDADMELVVEDTNFRDQLKGGESYDLIQRGGGISYHNRRLVSRAATGLYRGVTHEYLDIPGAGVINGVWYKDNADGSNRKDKFRRDIRLLKKGLKKEPENGRYWFYLGQSYRDAGQPDKALKAYRRRIEIGGWDEEIWNSKFNCAHCLQDMGDEAGFVRELIEAYNFRPNRAEPLYDLAKHYREQGKNYAALMIAEEGLRIPYPTDVLFVGDYVYSTGLREEFAITAFYDASRRSRGAAMCNQLSLDKQGTWASRNLARNNLFYYIEPLVVDAPSFVTRRIAFTPPDGYIPMNPSVTVVDGAIKAVLRSVNYTMDNEGRYLIKGTNGEANGTNPIRTRNFFLSLKDNFEVSAATEILLPEGFPAPAYDLVVGCEDMRLFVRDGDLWTISNVREQNQEGWCEQMLARIDPEKFRLTDYSFIRPLPRQHEKNWMPWVKNGALQFVYNLGTNVNATGAIWHGPEVPYAVDGLRGGSQVIDFHGGHLAIVHSAHVRPGDAKRYYQHRFVLMDTHGAITRISKPFYFHSKVIEFAAGMAWHPDRKRIMISYGLEDKEAWIATVDWHDIAGMLHD